MNKEKYRTGIVLVKKKCVRNFTSCGDQLESFNIKILSINVMHYLNLVSSNN